MYIPLLNGLHYEWAAAALRAGKHVLCEKPLTSNAAEARSLSRLAQAQGLVLFEAFHYRCLTMAILTMAILTMAILTMASCCSRPSTTGAVVVVVE